MDPRADLPFLDVSEAGDAHKARRLARARAIALSLLAGCVALFVASRALQPAYPWLSWVAAFSEAAIVGALADWYAVVVLFRHPMGLPLPHTAIVPSNQARIADNLASFIETHFLAAEPISRRLADIDFASGAADWLRDPARTKPLVDEVAQLLPALLRTLQATGLQDVLVRAARERLQALDWPTLSAALLETVTHENRHQALLDDLLAALHRLLADEEATDAMREKIRAELPAMFNAFRADAYLLKRLVASAAALLNDAQADRGHPLRKQFDDFVRRFIAQLKTSPAHREKVQAVVRDGLARPEVAEAVQALWQRLEAWLEADMATGTDSVVRARIAELLAGLGERLHGDAALRARLDASLRGALLGLVERHRHRVSQFVAEQVKGWDREALTRRIELNIGTDLQYIRINGTLVGGLIGVLLHALVRMLPGG